jgi:hypothetical protein
MRSEDIFCVLALAGAERNRELWNRTQYRPLIRNARQEIIGRLPRAPDRANAEKRILLSLSDVRQWFKSADVQFLAFTSALIHDARFWASRHLRRKNTRAISQYSLND